MSLWLNATAILEYGTLLLLLLLSVWSLKIMIDRWRAVRTISSPNSQIRMRELILAERWSELSQAAAASESGLPGGALQAALATPIKTKEAINHAVRSYLTEHRLQLEKGLPVLATLGSNAPFIGLFGTVLGIIQAFAVLGSQQGEAASIMTGISRALFATAAGLFVAIPAVVTFNFFSTKIREAMSESETLKDLYLSRLREER